MPQKNICSCVQKIKNKQGDARFFSLFVSACFTHSLVETLTVLFGNKDKNAVNEEA